jgi:glycosyltransferase involved in cell wall biosynthesis
VHVVVLSWRDVRNPEGGGAEIYLDRVARRLVLAGHDVTVACAAHDRAPRDEVVDGVRYRRRGGKLTVYPAAWLALATGRLGRPDVVVDVQNGMPFLSRWATRRPVVVLVHHVHREQWPVVYGAGAARVGWWIESWLSPRTYRRCRYVAVSRSTRDELVALGVDRDRVVVVHNGTDAPLPVETPRSPTPRVLVLTRLVPHKQVEHVLTAVALLRDRVPDVQVDVVGDGWWADRLRAFASDAGLDRHVVFHGHVSEPDKARLAAQAWVHATASLKEGWGLAVMEAAGFGVPTVGYRAAGGLAESVVHGETGWLVGSTPPELADALHLVIGDAALRRRLGDSARERARQFGWDSTAAWFEKVLWLAQSGDSPRAADDGLAS